MTSKKRDGNDIVVDIAELFKKKSKKKDMETSEGVKNGLEAMAEEVSKGCTTGFVSILMVDNEPVILHAGEVDILKFVGAFELAKQILLASGYDLDGADV